MDEPFRITPPRWKRTPDGGRAVELSIEWGELPATYQKKLKKSALATGKAIIDDRIQSLQAGLDGLREDVQAYFVMMDETKEEDR
jgi:hypothetical protein